MEEVRCVSYFKQGFDADDQGDFGKTTDGYSITTRPLHTVNPPTPCTRLTGEKDLAVYCTPLANSTLEQLARGVDAEGNVSITWLTLLGG